MSYENRGYRSRHEGGGNRYKGGGGGPNRYRDSRKNYGGGGGGGYHRPYDRPPPPKPKGDDEDIEVRLKGLIVKIGDKITSDLQLNLTKMRNILDNDFGKYPSTVQDTLKACVTELPAKSPVYGTLVGLLNASSHDIVGKLMTEFNQSLEEALSQSNFFKVKQLLRFYGELVNANVILPATYCSLLNDLLTPLDQANQLRQRLDCIVYIILAALPWCGRELNERSSSELNQILKKIEIYMQRRGTIPTLDILKPFKDDKYNPETQDALSHVWTLILDLQTNNWELPVIPKLYKWFDKEFTSALQHDLPRFTVASHNDTITYIKPASPLKLLVDEKGKSLPIIPSHESIDYFILQEVMYDILHLYEVNRKDCARYLLGIGTSFSPKMFKSIPLPPSHDDDDDDDMDTDDEDSKWSLADLIAENIFSHMLQLPHTPIREVFYSAVICELCRAEVMTFPKALGSAVKTLFTRLEFMDVECINRLCTWFSHHLSNFGFQWDWKAWDFVTELDPNHPQVCFVRETFEKERRLSYYERIKSLVPENLHGLMTAAPPAPDFAFMDSAHPLHAQAKTVIDALRAKKSVDEVKALLDQAKEQMDEQEQEKTVRFLFVECLLLVGSKSFSHILNVIERYLDILRTFNTTPEARLHTVQTVASFWKNNSQFLGILLDKLLNYRVIDPASVITWVFEPEQLQFVGRSFLWDILMNTLNKVNSRVAQIKSKLSDFQSLHNANKIKRENGEQNESTEAEAQQEIDSLRLVENSLASVTRDQKEVFMIVHQKFTQVLGDLIKSNPDPESNLQYRWVFGWFKEILRGYFKECVGFMTTLETLVFTSDLDERIQNVFNEIKTLKQENELLV